MRATQGRHPKDAPEADDGSPKAGPIGNRNKIIEIPTAIDRAYLRRDGL